MKKEALIINDLYHKYNKHKSSEWILNSINLKIETGQLLGLLGPSGCGKTTLLRLIAGFEYPSRGRIFLNNREISNKQKIGTRKTLSIETLSPLMAALSGEFFINENLTTKSWVGIIIVTTSLFIILRKGNDFKEENSSFSEKNNFKIFAFPFLSVLCAVLGGLLSRMVFLQSNLSPFLTTEIRLLGAIIFLISLKGFKINFFLKNLDKKQQKRFLISILLGTNVGIFLQQVVFKTLPIGIGWALLSISPVISLFFAKTEEREITKKIIFFTCFLFFGLTLIIL